MNALPDSVQLEIEEMMKGISLNKLSIAREGLSALYKQQIQGVPKLQTKETHLAYLAFRLPATYAALFDVFSRIKERCPDLVLDSLLDLGAGPGSVLLAAHAIFDHFSHATLVERDAFFIELGKKITASLGMPAIHWEEQDFKKLTINESYDLTVLSYALGELEASVVDTVLDAAFEKTKKVVVIVEPGTPRGYETIIHARSRLLQKGATVIAPCTHNKACPIPAGDWCHFSTRLPRSRLHRTIKDAALGYEDEKFSYVVLSTQGQQAGVPQASKSASRIIRRPFKGSGFVKLALCTANGILEPRTVSRRDKESFLLAKKADWGDLFFEDVRELSLQPKSNL